jgi:hypothetical protein
MAPIMDTAEQDRPLATWHSGELTIQRSIGVADRLADAMMIYEDCRRTVVYANGHPNVEGVKDGSLALSWRHAAFPARAGARQR